MQSVNYNNTFENIFSNENHIEFLFLCYTSTLAPESVIIFIGSLGLNWNRNSVVAVLSVSFTRRRPKLASRLHRRDRNIEGSYVQSGYSQAEESESESESESSG